MNISPPEHGDDPIATDAPGRAGESIAMGAHGRAGEPIATDAPGRAGEPITMGAHGRAGEPIATDAPGRVGDPVAVNAPGRGGEPAVVDAPGRAGGSVVSARDVVVRFGGVTALDRVSFEVVEGETLAVVGPNGAGKSTLLSLLAGTRRPSGGRLTVVGQDMMTRRRHRMARRGVGLAHQVPKPFGRLSVRENLEVAAQVLPHRRDRHAAVEAALEHTGLAGQAGRVAGSLGLLDLKRLELARALALRPRLLLLDEVAAGLNGHDLDRLIALLKDVRGFVPTMVLVEHVQDVIHELAERVVVLEWGKRIAEGTPAEIARDEQVIASYLGDSEVSFHRAGRSPAAPDGLLEVRDLHVSYGEVRALEKVSFSVGQGEIVSVLGANGAGKTTLARTLLGAVAAARGEVRLDGGDLTRLRPHQRVARGVSICPEGRRLFGDLSVLTNLELGLVGNKDRSRLDAAYELFPKLATLKDRKAGSLSGGEQQMVAIGRALASDPRLIVMDEVSLGLAPVVVDRLYEAILKIQSWGTAVLLVEQSVHRALAISDRVLLLRHGRPVFFGPAQEVDEAAFAELYLGAAHPDPDAPADASSHPHTKVVR